MRGLVDDLPTPHPLGETLPAMFQEDDFVQRLCGALDQVLAPVVSTLDSLTAYLDPDTAPEDLLEWLAGWVGVALDGATSSERRRALLREGVELHRWRGTAQGIKRAVAAVYDTTPEIIDSGGATWSADPTESLLGDKHPELVVRLRVDNVDAVDRRQLDAVITAVKPVHVPHRAEVLPRTP
jgi:phage tail-like protein